MRRRNHRPDSASDVSAVTRRIASLLRAGIPTVTVFRAALAADPHHDALVTIDVGVQRGLRTSEAIASVPGASWAILASVWAVAEHSGAPLAVACDRMVTVFTALQHLQDRRRVLLAGPTMTLWLICALPIASVALGETLGFGVVQSFGTPIGVVLLLAGLLLMTTGIVWTRSLIRQFAHRVTPSGVECELLWLALTAGMPTERATTLVIRVMDHFRTPGGDPAAFGRDGSVQRVIDLAADTGESVSRALLALADQHRQEAGTLLEMDAERLAIRVLIPLGCCILPAFVCVGVMPILLSLLGALNG